MIRIKSVTQTPLPVDRNHMREWKGPDDPPRHWYKTFNSMQYNIYQLAGENIYTLMPVPGRPVYTFDDYGDFIETAREFTITLFSKKRLISDVPQYRMRRDPPCQHTIYRLPPFWTWQD